MNDPGDGIAPVPALLRGRPGGVYLPGRTFLPIPIQNALWLNEIGLKRDSLLKDTSPESIRQMTVFLDTHCVMIHRNGHEWYDVHPIIRDDIAEIVKREQRSPQVAPPK